MIVGGWASYLPFKCITKYDAFKKNSGRDRREYSCVNEWRVEINLVYKKLIRE